MDLRVLARRRIWAAMLSLAFALLSYGCEPAAQPPDPVPPSPTEVAAVEVRISASKTALLPGEKVELVAETRNGPGERWTEIDAVWRADPADLGVLEVPLMQETGSPRTFFTARAPGRVTILAEPPATGDVKGQITLEITDPATPTGGDRPDY